MWELIYMTGLFQISGLYCDRNCKGLTSVTNARAVLLSFRQRPLTGSCLRASWPQCSFGYFAARLRVSVAPSQELQIRRRGRKEWTPHAFRPCSCAFQGPEEYVDLATFQSYEPSDAIKPEPEPFCCQAWS